NHSAGVGLEKTHDVVQRYRFAHAAAAQYAECLCRKDIKADMIEYTVVAKRFADILEFDVGLRGVGFLRHRPARRDSIQNSGLLRNCARTGIRGLSFSPGSGIRSNS